MSFSIGYSIKVTISGQSHDPFMAVNISGIPEGLLLDEGRIKKFLERRRPGSSNMVTPRNEADIPIVHSGILNGVTTGEIIVVTFENTNRRGSDYEQFKTIPRPSHADYLALKKYGADYDISGGGIFSARLTLPLCYAGAVCLQILEQSGVTVGAHIASIGSVEDDRFDPVNLTASQLNNVSTGHFAALNLNSAQEMKAEILAASADGDSVGGSVEVGVVGLPQGLGTHMFDGLEPLLSRMYFSLPAVRAVEFGKGFTAAAMRGSQHNDSWTQDGKTVKTKTNHAGGIVGGMATGMPLIARVGFKPTPSISRPQNTLNIKTGLMETLLIKGRHDPCVAVRAVPCVEAVTAIVLADVLATEK